MFDLEDPSTSKIFASIELSDSTQTQTSLNALHIAETADEQDLKLEMTETHQTEMADQVHEQLRSELHDTEAVLHPKTLECFVKQAIIKIHLPQLNELQFVEMDLELAQRNAMMATLHLVMVVQVTAHQ